MAWARAARGDPAGGCASLKSCCTAFLCAGDAAARRRRSPPNTLSQVGLPAPPPCGKHSLREGRINGSRAIVSPNSEWSAKVSTTWAAKPAAPGSHRATSTHDLRPSKRSSQPPPKHTSKVLLCCCCWLRLPLFEGEGNRFEKVPCPLGPAPMLPVEAAAERRHSSFTHAARSMRCSASMLASSFPLKSSLIARAIARHDVGGANTRPNALAAPFLLPPPPPPPPPLPWSPRQAARSRGERE
mmetsp:Transcript_16554/g.33797  ORF Transcript_16554/g.33797 Transcript_16554/m.33797 type:complete len:242 (-) Transcript_16554:285-1010(-)